MSSGDSTAIENNLILVYVSYVPSSSSFQHVSLGSFTMLNLTIIIVIEPLNRHTRIDNLEKIKENYFLT